MAYIEFNAEEQILAGSSGWTAQALRDLRRDGFLVLPGRSLENEFAINPDDAKALADSWNFLEPDRHLADGGNYRYRRHASLVQTFEPDALCEVPHRPHWQPRAYNKLHGGYFRDFEPVLDSTAQNDAYRSLISGIGTLLHQHQKVKRWHIEVHQFRIDAWLGNGMPTPEGLHRDGVDYVAMILIHRGSVAGGVTSISNAEGISLWRATLEEPWTLLLLDDQRLLHGTTPITASGLDPVRDMFVVTYRASGFLEPSSPDQY